jgi:hypothetical protein
MPLPDTPPSTKSSEYGLLFRYFLIGLLFSLIGLVGGSLWIKYKEKTNKRDKYIFLLIGSIIPLIFLFQELTAQTAKKYLYANYPEIEEVQQELTSRYPEETFSVGSTFDQSFNGNTATSSSTLTVTYNSKKSIAPEEVQDIAATTCLKLTELQKDYTYVSITGIQKYWIFHSTYEASRTCDKWLNEPI